LTLALPFFVAMLASATLVPIIRAVALRLGYVVPSRGPQASSKPKALFGGVAIALALFACAVAFDTFEAVPVLFWSSAF
jgi:UDP-N-acetylmuramyl pentapeptide phosphotransferase/UDP-N-acetylglucosamine-1-phosphate transferase